MGDGLGERRCGSGADRRHGSQGRHPPCLEVGCRRGWIESLRRVRDRNSADAKAGDPERAPVHFVPGRAGPERPEASVATTGAEAKTVSYGERSW